MTNRFQDMKSRDSKKRSKGSWLMYASVTVVGNIEQPKEVKYKCFSIVKESVRYCSTYILYNPPIRRIQ